MEENMKKKMVNYLNRVKDDYKKYPPSTEKKKELVNYLERGDLKRVIYDYEKNPESRTLTIPRTGETALHVAVSDEWEQLASRMVRVADSGVLKMRNWLGETALHLAAKFDHTYLCKLIAVKDPILLRERNDYGETPLFSAVSRGNTKAFLYLNDLQKRTPSSFEYCTRTDGDTILHSAISGHHFSIAYIIIKEHPRLMDKENNDRVSPLHLLATMPSVFPSGVHLSGIRKLVYHSIRVRKLAQTWAHYKVPDPQPQPIWKTRLKRKHLNSILEKLEDEPTNSQVCRGEIDHQDEEAANKQGPLPTFAHLRKLINKT